MPDSTNAKNIARFESDLHGLKSIPDPMPSARAALSNATRICLLGGNSALSRLGYGGLIAEAYGGDKEIVVVDDTVAKCDLPFKTDSILSTSRFAEWAAHGDSQGALAVNLATQLFSFFFFAGLLEQTKEVMELPLPQVSNATVYETAVQTRELSLRRLPEYVELARMLADSFSLETLFAVLKMRVGMDHREVFPVQCSWEDEYFSIFPNGREVTFSLGEDEIFVDVGAYDGDTIRKFLTATHGRYSAIHAFEPDKRNFAALAGGALRGFPRLSMHRAVVSDARGAIGFTERPDSASSHVQDAGETTISAVRLDDEIETCTFIKMDVEGHEAKVLRGARRLLRESRPRLAITCYHYADDLLEIAGLIKDINPLYRLRLRHHGGYYQDSVLYADCPEC
ncbi:MAG TPA: FkbM family methyltransferase [Azoarcus taiwanensis]|nr:FkbM family methyltransferase [Azoarcus taiwanensis]